MSFHSIALLNVNRDPAQRRVRLGYIWYTCIMLVLLAFALLANVLMGQLMWIDNRNYPGGPIQYFTDKSTIWFNILGSATDILGDFMSNGLLVGPKHLISNLTYANSQIYRCYMIWNRNWRIIVLPSIMYIASDGMSINRLHAQECCLIKLT